MTPSDIELEHCVQEPTQMRHDAAGQILGFLIEKVL
jgi:hypothetical protein